MKTTGVLPEALAASISRFSRSETDAMAKSLRLVKVPDPSGASGEAGGSLDRDGAVPLLERGAVPAPFGHRLAPGQDRPPGGPAQRRGWVAVRRHPGEQPGQDGVGEVGRRRPRPAER